MTGKDDYQSSEDLIRQARSDIESNRGLGGIGNPDVASETGDSQDQEMVRPADRIDSRPARTPVPKTVSRRPPPPTPQPVVVPAATDLKRLRRGGWLAVVAGVVLLIPAALTLLTFVFGLIGSDPEVTENVIGFVVLLAMMLVPGVLLIRWARRGRSRSPNYPS
jgi:hypothetical protein